MGNSYKGGGIKQLLVIPDDKTRGNGPKWWLQRFRLTLGEGGGKKKNITEREVQHWNTLLRVPMDTPSLEPPLDMA